MRRDMKRWFVSGYTEKEAWTRIIFATTPRAALNKFKKLEGSKQLKRYYKYMVTDMMTTEEFDNAERLQKRVRRVPRKARAEEETGTEEQSPS